MQINIQINLNLERLAKKIKSNKVKKIALDDRSGTDKAIISLLSTIQHNTSIVQLSIRNRTFSHEVAENLAYLICNSNSIKHLEIDHNTLENNSIKVIANAISQSKSIKDLNISWNRFGDEGAKALAAVLPQCQSIEHLNVSANGISSEGMKALAYALLKIASLTSLNISHNNLGPEGAAAVAYAIPKITSLASLDISHNNIGSEGAIELAFAIQKITSLKVLNINSNNIGIEGIRILADVIPTTAINSLDIRNNDLFDDGIEAIASVLPRNGSITHLYINENRFSEISVYYMEKALLHNWSLYELSGMVLSSNCSHLKRNKKNIQKISKQLLKLKDSDLFNPIDFEKSPRLTGSLFCKIDRCPYAIRAYMGGCEKNSEQLFDRVACYGREHFPVITGIFKTANPNLNDKTPFRELPPNTLGHIMEFISYRDIIPPTQQVSHPVMNRHLCHIL